MTNVERFMDAPTIMIVENVSVITDSAFVDVTGSYDLEYEAQGIVLRETLRLTNEDAGYEILRYMAAPREDFHPYIWALEISRQETRPVYLIVEDMS